MIEKEIIDLAQKYFSKPNKNILKDIGDDCAVVKVSDFDSSVSQLFTVDTLIEDIHFLFDKIPPYLLGWKSLAVNISDIASMGGIPEYALLSLGINEKVDSIWLNDFYKGILDCANENNINVIGGDTIKSPKSTVISITLTGRSHRPIYRDNSNEHDLIVSTGCLGLSGAGLWCIKNNIKNDFCIEKHYKPIPRVKEGLFLSEHIKRLSMMDSSDGLYKSVETLCQQSNSHSRSNLGVDIFFDNLDIHNSLKEVSDIGNINVEDFILFGGEDYELIFSLSESEFNEIKDKYKNTFGYDLNVVGRFTQRNGVYLIKDNKSILLNDKSFKHF